MLSLLRGPEFGDFSRSEIHALTFALHAASNRFSELRLMDSEAGVLPAPALPAVDQAPLSAGADLPALYLLNERFEIVLTWSSQDEPRAAAGRAEPAAPDRLPAVLEREVRRLTASWSDVERLPGVARPLPFLELRTRSMSGSLGEFIGVSLERAKVRRSLTGAAGRFKISPREAQVLALLLDGLSLNQIAKRLHITSSTVQDHVQHLLRKTGTRSRLEMTAKILGWE
jgi:DNA-binding CsgD family transcriptional regulator